MKNNQKIVSVSRSIAASPEAVFEILANPYQHHLFDGSNTVKEATSGPQLLELGSKFRIRMEFHGVPYRITNTVKEFEENKLIAWSHFGKHRWRYEIDLIDGDTIVTESFDWSTAISQRLIQLGGYPTRHLRNMASTLSRLEEYLNPSAA